jgi:hypothetical protein
VREKGDTQSIALSLKRGLAIALISTRRLPIIEKASISGLSCGTAGTL